MTARASLRFGDDEHGLRPDSRHRVHRNLSRRQRRAPATSAPRRSCTVVASAAELANIVERPQSACRRAAASIRSPPRACAATRRRRSARQERAVTPEDYAEVTERHSRRAARRGDAALDRQLAHGVHHGRSRRGRRCRARCEPDLAPFVDRYRMAGHDLEFDDPLYVSLEIELHVCVKPDYFRERRRSEACSTRSAIACCRTGAAACSIPTISPSAQTVYLSQLYAAAQAVPGVASVAGRHVPAPGHRRPDLPRRRRAAARPARDRASRQRSELPGARRAARSTSTAASRERSWTT